MRTVKCRQSAYSVDVIPASMARQSGPPHLTRQSEGKIQLAVEDFPAEKSSSVSALFFATSVLSVSA
ncbi:hypothetical protein [Escherichia coli]|uniref:hypothetical protein n=1 Tax=Escherichia coli TaxID=562 RepID=UPI003CC90BAE